MTVDTSCVLENLSSSRLFFQNERVDVHMPGKSPELRRLCGCNRSYYISIREEHHP